jgi:hypothetical protein
MLNTRVIAAAASLAAAAVASAHPILQFDVNQFSVQAYNTVGVQSAFGGMSHSGSVHFSTGQGILNGIFIQSVPNGNFVNAGFSGSTLSSFTGQIDLANGIVTGGHISLDINNGDHYTCDVTPSSGAVSTFVGGGYVIQSLTRNGFFNDAQFGNVNVSQWFNNQGLAGLMGSLLQFNFNPNAAGLANSDMDYFVNGATVVPLPSAAWAGLATLGGLIGVRRLKRA